MTGCREDVSVTVPPVRSYVRQVQQIWSRLRMWLRLWGTRRRYPQPRFTPLCATPPSSALADNPCSGSGAPSSQFSLVSTQSARVGRKQVSALGKMRTKHVLRTSASDAKLASTNTTIDSLTCTTKHDTDFPRRKQGRGRLPCAPCEWEKHSITHPKSSSARTAA
jgi:hypothetical protein